MKTSLKSILNGSNILYIGEKSNLAINIQNSLKIFFANQYYSSDIDIAYDIYLQKNISVIISEISNSANIKFLKFIRQYNHKIPIIVVSNISEHNVILELIRIQIIDLVSTPININNFIFALNNTAKHLLREGNIVSKFNKKYIYNHVNKTIQVDEEIKPLTKNESKLLELLLSKHGKIVSKKEIENYIWGEVLVSDSAFKSLFQRLKTKIGKDSIVNKSSLGYFLRV